MKRIYKQTNTAEQLCHMAWSALIATSIAKSDPSKKLNNRIAVNKFIAHWALKAQRETRFGLVMNSELAIWISNGSKNAMVAKLEQNLMHIYDSYFKLLKSHKEFPASFKRRIDNASKLLSEKGNWDIQIGLERDWVKDGEYNCTAENTAIIVKEHMDIFDNVGRFEHPISLVINSNNKTEAIEAFYSTGILLFLEASNVIDGKQQYKFSIWPKNSAPDNLQPAKIQKLIS